MFAILHALGMLVADLFKSRRRLEAENLLLRHQLAIAMRRAPPRFRLRGSDRELLVWITRLWPSLLDVVQLVQGRPSCVGIALGSKDFGVGNRVIGQGGQGLIVACAI